MSNVPIVGHSALLAFLLPFIIMFSLPFIVEIVFVLVNHKQKHNNNRSRSKIYQQELFKNKQINTKKL